MPTVKKAGVRWEYQKDDLVSFNQFLAPQVATLENEWEKGTKHFSLDITLPGGGAGKKPATTMHYAINLDKMTQLNTKSKKERTIRRVAADGEVCCGRIAVWEWQSAHGEFKPFSLEESAAIERNYAKDTLKTTVKVAKGAHDTVDVTIHFGHMTQSTEDNPDKHRAVRRVFKAVEIKGKGAGAVAGGDASSAITVTKSFVAGGETTKATASPKTAPKKAALDRIPPTDDDEEDDESPRVAKLRKGTAAKKEAETAGGGGAGVASTRGKRTRDGDDDADGTTTTAAIKPDESVSLIPSVGKVGDDGRLADRGLEKEWTLHDGTVMLLSMHRHPILGESYVKPRGKKKAAEAAAGGLKLDPSKKIKVAAFDMDDTLVKPPGKNVFPVSRTDWEWMCGDAGGGGQGSKGLVPSKLRQLHEDGYHIVIVSNQAGVSTEPAKANHLKGKIVDMMAGLGNTVPISAALATGKDEYRKPEPALWELIQEELLYGMPIDYSRSFYCGDAAGRYGPTIAGRKKDFSCSDRKFAYNAGLKFYTPDEYFLLKPTVKDFHWDGVSPTELKALPKRDPDAKFHLPKKEGFEVVIMCGFPGCGKSSFYRKYLKSHGYAWANRDTLKTKEKCLQACKDALAAGKSVCIDNTNPAIEDRKIYIDAAKKAKAGVRVFRMQATIDMAQHMNAVRMRGGGEHIPGVAYQMFRTRLREPDAKSEGITGGVVQVPVEVDFSFPGGEEVERVFYKLS